MRLFLRTKQCPVLLQCFPVLFRTTLYYKVLLQYYPVLRRRIPCYKVLSPVLHRTTPVLLCTTKYYCVLKSLTWNFTDIARTNRRRCPTSPNTVPATKIERDRIVRPNNPAASPSRQVQTPQFLPKINHKLACFTPSMDVGLETCKQGLFW